MPKARGSNDQSSPAKPRKKPYLTPKLVRYGSILKLTQATGSGNGDTGMIMMAACL